jgi:glycerol-3-phosphate acyltransferase PlsX
VGLRGVVVKSHGGADVMAFRNALTKAHAEASEGILERIATRMAAAHAKTAVAPLDAASTSAASTSDAQ